MKLPFQKHCFFALLLLHCVMGVSTVFAQTISYLIPDIGSEGQNTYMEIIGPYNQNGNFGTDGFYLNNPGDAVRVICANAADTNTIKIGPLVVSWDGRMISTQVFVMQGVAPNSIDWQQLSSSFKIPIQVILNGGATSNADTFYVVKPQAAIVTAAAGLLGNGGVWGVRSRRGALIFDSLIFQNGAVVSVTNSDCDVVTPGNQGFLPLNVISRGRVYIDNGAVVVNDAPGGQNTDGAVGGGGGGTESYTNCAPGAGGVNHAGDGFTGGGTELLEGETPGAGTGSIPVACAPLSGISLNGVPGGKGHTGCHVDEGGGGGGTGHPFGSSGGKDGEPGGYGGGTGYSGFGGGGYGADGITPATIENGKAHGNSQMVPFAGGSGGGAGVAGAGTSRGGGGGGGGAITLHSHLSIDGSGSTISAKGGAGVIGCGGYRGGGGGSGGGVVVSGKLNSNGGAISVNGGPGGVGGGGSGGAGGAGRVRFDGPFVSQPAISPLPGSNSASQYIGPSTDTTMYVARSFNLTGTGNGQPISIYVKPITKAWQLVATVTGYTNNWTQNIVMPCPDTAFLLVVAQDVPSPNNAPYLTEPAKVFSQSAANYLVVKNALKAHAGNDTAVCPGSCFAIGAAPPATGGVPPYVFLWHPHTSPNDSTTANPTICVYADVAYALKVTDSSGCYNIDTVKIHVYDKPVANFSTSDICQNVTATFHDTSTIASGTIVSWSWNFGDGTALSALHHPTHNYATAGTYTVTLKVTSNNGCIDSISKSIVIHPLPIVLFNTNNVCNGVNAAFVDFSSILATDTLNSWIWNFGDATALNHNHLVTGGHLYADTGIYSVKLIVSSNFGCVDSVSQSIIVRPNPIANFLSTKVCNGNSTSFSDSSTTAAGIITLWKWNFDDGSNAVFTQNTSHLYDSAGIHITTLIVQNNFGCADTISKNVKVYFNPIAGFTFNDVCIKDSMYFVNTSSVDTSSSIATYVWLFDDGSSSTLTNPVHLYTQSGTYHVTLLVKTIDSCSNAITLNVHVYDPPIASFTVNNVCLIDSAQMMNTSLNPAVGSISNWSWDFGDNSTQNAIDQNPHHLYSSTGVYEITLISHSSNLGCADTATDSIHVYAMPYADFSSNDVCLGSAINYLDASLIALPDSVSTWSWNFGGAGAASAVQNPVRTFSNAGTYTVTLIVNSNHGCADTVQHSSIVHPKPIPQFTTHNVCLGSVTNFVDASSVPVSTTNDVLAAWSWSFGDNGGVNNNQNAMHLYVLADTFTVQLLVTTDYGCKDSIQHTVVINPNPIVDFIRNDSLGCEPVCVTFNDATVITPGSNQSWLWDYGDGSASGTGISTTHCYTNDSVTAPVNYTVTLTVTSDSGCVSTLTKPNNITVYPLPHAAFDVLPTSATITNPVISVNDLSIGASNWIWNWGGGDTNIVIQNPLPHSYADTGTYTITLFTSTPYNCKDSAYHTVVIEPDFIFYVPNAFTPDDDGVNDTFIGKGIFIKEFEMSIFDRWGNLIYQTDSINKPWDGKANKGTQPSQTDVYVYSIKVTDFKLLKHTYRGTVTLVK